MCKKGLSILLTLCIGVMALAGCSGTSTPASEASDNNPADEFIVGFSNNSDTYDYCAKFRSYLKEETQSLGINIIVTDAAGDTNVQHWHSGL